MIKAVDEFILSPFNRSGLCRYNMERDMGIEPTYPAWKAGVLADVLHLHRKPAGERRLPHGDRNLKKGEKVFYFLYLLYQKFFIKSIIFV